MIIPARMDTFNIVAPATFVDADAPARVERIDVIAIREPKVASVPVGANCPI